MYEIERITTAWQRVDYGGGPILWFFHRYKIVPGYGCWIISMNVDVERKFFKAGPRRKEDRKGGRNLGTGGTKGL